MFRYLKNIGVNHDDSAELRLKKFTLLIIALCCFIAAPIWSYSYYLMGLTTSALIPLAYMLIIGPAIVLFAINKNERLLLNIQLVAIFLCPTVMQWLAGGYLKGGVIILWAFLAPINALVFHDIKKAQFWMAMVLGTILCTGFFNGYFEHWGNYTDRSQKVLQITMNLSGAIMVIYFSMQYFVRTINKNNSLLMQEKEKSDKLLLNILPAQIAEELKANGKTHPTLYTDTTIIFSDFKDFTQFSELFTPEELVGELEECFNSFDEIIAKNGLEKIKTIGDAYMCVAGIPRKEDDAEGNAVNAIMAALEIADFIEKIKKEKNKAGKVFWDIRIGVHTGDVVAGIVGKKKFVFDIWGDAVNTASRLETCSEGGKINISGTTYQLVKEYFNCSYRGKLAVKNKGELDMYFVESIIPEAIFDHKSKYALI
ncbi:MAG: family 3 adenylate cyclase [Flavipsychrobacter sp.]|nr:family 3 adenylate cyclase [Flavipsychrobacter sp.]